MDLIKNSFLEAQQVLEAFISDEKNLGQVKNAGDLLVDMFRQGGKVFSWRQPLRCHAFCRRTYGTFPS